ncbi:MAG TPA: OFA family MFS transporter, partial [Burkholderiales bacterium]|nr:OFA family MFS transporter [Burkholderiales bacterium]
MTFDRIVTLLPTSASLNFYWESKLNDRNRPEVVIPATYLLKSTRHAKRSILEAKRHKKSSRVQEEIRYKCGDPGKKPRIDLRREAMRDLALRALNSRWTVAVGGAMFMMTLGTIYSWSLFAQPLLACFGWSSTTVTWAFALAIFSLGTGAVVGGRLQDLVGPRKVALTGVMLWSLGNFLAGLGTAHFGATWLYLTYGLIGGFGVGMGYVTPVAVVTKWFPERRGLAGGIVVMGFGLGAVLYNVIVKSIPSFAAAAEAAAEYSAQMTAAAHGTLNPAFAQTHVLAIMNVFLFSGIAFAVLAGACAALLRNPPSALPDDTGAASSEAVAWTTREMLRTPQFYFLWLMLFFNVTAGILVISQAVPIMEELTRVAPAMVAATYGGVALFNALGRFFWGAISDRIGGTRTFALIFGIQVVVFGTMGGIHNL